MLGNIPAWTKSVNFDTPGETNYFQLPVSIRFFRSGRESRGGGDGATTPPPAPCFASEPGAGAAAGLTQFDESRCAGACARISRSGVLYARIPLGLW